MKITKHLTVLFISLGLLPSNPAFAQSMVLPKAICTTFVGNRIIVRYPRIDGSALKNILKIGSISDNTVSSSTVDYYIGKIKLVEVTPNKGMPSFFGIPKENKFKEFYRVNLTYQDGLSSSPLFLKVQYRNVKLYLTSSSPNYRSLRVPLSTCRKIEFKGLEEEI